MTGHEDAGVGIVKNGVHQVNYSLPIPISLLATPLYIQCDPYPGTFEAVNAGVTLIVAQVQGPVPVVLSNVHLVESDVDFMLRTMESPR